MKGHLRSSVQDSSSFADARLLVSYFTNQAAHPRRARSPGLLLSGWVWFRDYSAASEEPPLTEDYSPWSEERPSIELCTIHCSRSMLARLAQHRGCFTESSRWRTPAIPMISCASIS